MRFAPSLALIKSLLDEGVEIRAYDPEAMKKAKSIVPNITYCVNPYDAAQDADAIVIVTEWDEFRSLDWGRLRTNLERPLILDGRNMLDPMQMSHHGFQYISVGRNIATAHKLTDSVPSSRNDLYLRHSLMSPAQ